MRGVGRAARSPGHSITSCIRAFLPPSPALSRPWSWGAAPQQKGSVVGTVPCCSPPWDGNSPGKELPQAQPQRCQHKLSQHMALQRHWVSRANVLGSGCHKQPTQAHPLKRCTCPNFVQKGGVLQCSDCPWPSPAPRAPCFCGSGWMEMLWVTFTSQCPSRKKHPSQAAENVPCCSFESQHVNCPSAPFG